LHRNDNLFPNYGVKVFITHYYSYSNCRIFRACHQDIPNGSMPISVLTTAAEKLGMKLLTDEEHAALINRDINLAAWIQVLIPILLVVLVLVFIGLKKS